MHLERLNAEINLGNYIDMDIDGWWTINFHRLVHNIVFSVQSGN